MGLFTEKFRKPRLSPSPRQTLAVTLDQPKTAALAFDRIYAPMEAGVPVELTPGFAWISRWGAVEERIQPAEEQPNVTRLGHHGKGIFRATTPSLRVKVATDRGSLQHQLRTCKDALWVALERENLRPVEFLDDIAQTYSPGDHQFVMSVVEGVVGIDEYALSWAQVVEFRKDVESREAYRAMTLWFNDSCKGMSKSEVEDRVCLAYEQGKIALKKHGILAQAGAAATILGPATQKIMDDTWWLAGLAVPALVVGIYMLRLNRKETRLRGPLAYIQKLENLGDIKRWVDAETRAKLAAGRDMVEDL